MILLKIGFTLISVALMCVWWYVVGDIIRTIILDRKYGAYCCDDIPLLIFCTLIATGITLLVVYGLSVFY